MLPLNNSEMVFLAALKPFVNLQAKNLIETMVKLCQEPKNMTLSQKEKQSVINKLVRTETSSLISLFVVRLLIELEGRKAAAAGDKIPKNHDNLEPCGKTDVGQPSR